MIFAHMCFDMQCDRRAIRRQTAERAARRKYLVTHAADVDDQMVVAEFVHQAFQPADQADTLRRSRVCR